MRTHNTPVAVNMKAISLCQPWATLIAIGAKGIETRSWRTSYRGLIAIHATKHMPLAASDVSLREPAFSILGTAGLRAINGPARGAIVAVARLVECRATGAVAVSATQPTDPWPRAWVRELSEQERAFGNFDPFRFGWFLEDVRALPKPIPCRGVQGLWNVPAEIAAVLARVGEDG